MMWENANSFDEGEMQQVMNATSSETEKALQKQDTVQIINNIYVVDI